MPVARIVLVIISDTPGSEASVVFQTTKVSDMDALRAFVIFRTTIKITLTMLTAHSCAAGIIGNHEWQNPPECGNHKLDENQFHMSEMMNV